MITEEVSQNFKRNIFIYFLFFKNFACLFILPRPRKFFAFHKSTWSNIPWRSIFWITAATLNSFHKKRARAIRIGTQQTTFGVTAACVMALLCTPWKTRGLKTQVSRPRPRNKTLPRYTDDPMVHFSCQNVTPVKAP